MPWPTTEQVVEVCFALPCLAAGVACFYRYTYHKGKATRYEEISPAAQPGPDLHRYLMGMEGKEIPYAAVSGYVQTSDGQKPLKSPWLGIPCVATAIMETTLNTYNLARPTQEESQHEILSSGFFLSRWWQLSEGARMSDDNDHRLVAVKAKVDDVRPVLETIGHIDRRDGDPQRLTWAKALTVGRFLTVIGRVSINETGRLQVSVPSPTSSDEFIIINSSLDELISSHFVTAWKYKITGSLFIGGFLLLLLFRMCMHQVEGKTVMPQQEEALDNREEDHIHPQ